MDLGHSPRGRGDPHGQAGIVTACLGTVAVVNLMFSALSPGLPAAARELGQEQDGTLVAQLVQTVPSIAMILGSALIGYLSQRIGRRAVMILGLAIYSLAGFAGLFAQDVPQLMTVRVLSGLAGGALITTVYATVGEYFESGPRMRMLGFLSMVSSLSSIVISPLAGALVDAYGWRSPFSLFLVGLALIPVAWCTLRRGPASSRGVELSWRPMLGLWGVVLLVVVYSIGVFMMAIQGPFVVTARADASGALIGALIAVTAIMGATGGAFYGVLGQWLGVRAMFVLISLGFGGGMILAVNATSLALLVVAFAVMGVGAGIVEPTLATEALDRTPPALHDRAAGMVIAGLFLGQFLNPWLMNPLQKIGGIDFAFIFVGICWLVGAALFLAACVARPGRAFPRLSRAGTIG